MTFPSSDQEGVASAAPFIARRARPPWNSLSDDEKLKRLDDDLWATGRRIEKVEGELLETQDRLRLLFRDLGQSRRRLNALMPRDGDGPSTLCLDYTENGDD
jgi:hypothetical protein